MATDTLHTRRSFVASATASLMAFVGVPGAGRHGCAHAPSPGPHPDPRPDVDSSRVLKPEEIGSDPSLLSLYDGIREIPHIADGIRCMCGCAENPAMRSLLTCFESNGMARYCNGCQTEGAMVVRLHKAGRTLDQLRRAVDARFGSG